MTAFSQERLASPVVSPEFPEAEIIAGRVADLQREAAEGRFGGPLVFLASKELEIVRITPIVELVSLLSEERLARHPEVTQLLAGLDLPVKPFAENQATRVEQLREEARAYVEALDPADEGQAQKKAQWLAEVDKFTNMDLANFQLYREFSTPTLGKTSPPKGATYGEMLAYGQSMGWLEFRFGGGLFEEGYYDANRSIIEIRLTPCSPSELAAREAIILQRFKEIALGLGELVVQTYPGHTGVSVYVVPESGDTTDAMPLVGTQEDRVEATLDVVTGLGAAIEDGVFISGSMAREGELMESGSKLNASLISTLPNDLRVRDDYIELRQQDLQPSTNHGLLWMMAGMSLGLQLRKDGLAARGYAAAEMADILLADQTDNYRSDPDVILHRLIESAHMTEDGSLRVREDFVINSAERFAKLLGLEGLDPRESVFFISLLTGTFTVDKEGVVSFDRQIFEDTAAVFKEKYSEAAEKMTEPSFLDGVEALVRRAQTSLRFRRSRGVALKIRLSARNPDQWVDTWRQSPVVEAAYGDRAPDYILHLADTALRGRIEDVASD